MVVRDPTFPPVGVNLRRGGAAASPSPLWGGVGVGVTQCRAPLTPTKGEGRSLPHRSGAPSRRDDIKH